MKDTDVGIKIDCKIKSYVDTSEFVGWGKIFQIITGIVRKSGLNAPVLFLVQKAL